MYVCITNVFQFNHQLVAFTPLFCSVWTSLASCYWFKSNILMESQKDGLLYCLLNPTELKLLWLTWRTCRPSWGWTSRTTRHSSQVDQLLSRYWNGLYLYFYLIFSWIGWSHVSKMNVQNIRTHIQMLTVWFLLSLKGWRCVWVHASPRLCPNGRLHLLWAGNLLKFST